ncbi:hypothetical protein [Noviluteimonas dokdonensis]|nr:hypothetical protein [Lysobacter dokdonensis]
MSGVRVAAALACAALVAVAAVQMSRVDTEAGRAFGPDRLQRRLDAAPSPDAHRARQARAILATRPIDGRAYRTIALAEQRDALITIAGARGPRDPMTLATLTDRSLAAGEIETGLTHLDALLRVAPATRELFLPLLMPHLHDARVRDSLVERLAQDPPWRGAFLATLRSEAAPAADADALLAALARRTPADEDMQRTRIAVLDRAGRHADARAAWIATLPVHERALAEGVFDGGFEAGQGNVAGYGWWFDDVPGAIVEIARDAPRSGKAALSVEFDDRAVRFSAVHQSLALAPGRYRLQAAALDRVDSTRPFEWRLACTNGAKLAQLPLARDADWRVQSVDFDVPSACTQQSLVLVHAARSLAERRLRGRLLVDDLGIFLIPSSSSRG